MEAREQIDEIQNEIIGSSNRLLAALSGAIKRIEQVFPRYGSFVMEYIQNADDASSRKLMIDLLEDSIAIHNDGRVFTSEDVDSICSIGVSSKAASDYIGYLGVGFKSTFLISDSVQIHSGGFHFKFDKHFWDDAATTPWEIIPIWVESSPTPPAADLTTSFLAEMRSGDRLEQIREETQTKWLNPRVLLFLRNLTTLEIRDAVSQTTRNLRKQSENDERSGNYEIVSAEEHHDSELVSRQRWVVFRKTCRVPPEVQSDEATERYERKGITKREVVVAFRLDEDDRLIPEPEGTAHIGVYSFLPLKEVELGLGFLVHADFLTTTGRTDILRESLWNQWLVREISDLITDTCVPVFKEHENWRYSFTEPLYSRSHGHELFERFLKEPIRDYLQDEPCLVASDGTFVRPNEAVRISAIGSELGIQDDDIRDELMEHERVLHEKCSTNLDVERAIHYSTKSEPDRYLTAAIRNRAKRRDMDFFKKLWQRIGGYSYSSLRRVAHWNTPTVPTRNWRLETPPEVFINPEKIELPPDVDLHVVHPELVMSDEALHALLHTGTRELTHSVVESLRTERGLHRLVDSWQEMSEKERLRELRGLKALFDGDKANRADLAFVTLKATSGEWVEPERLVFPSEYYPNHRVQSLVENGLLDWPIEFVSPQLVDDVDESDLWRWSKFFKMLGVDSILSETGPIQKIGVLTSLRYEEKMGRGNKARELGESDSQSKGCDLMSENEAGPMYIEVKARVDPHGSITITANQFRALVSNPQNAFVYVVTNVLRNPTLSIIPGASIVDSDAVRTINYATWNGLTEREYRPLEDRD